MKIELIGTPDQMHGLHRMHVAIPQGTDQPLLTTVRFVRGVAECADNVGQYLIDQGHAKPSGKVIEAESTFKAEAKAAEDAKLAEIAAEDEAATAKATGKGKK